jgi:hypothetical protein
MHEHLLNLLSDLSLVKAAEMVEREKYFSLG